MKKLIKPSEVKGSIVAPASKSVAQRLLLLSSLLSGESSIEVNSLCDDIEYCAKAVEGLGAKVSFNSGVYTVISDCAEILQTINCGESGTCLRMICALCAKLNKEITLTGEGSLLIRPMDMGVSPLEDLGVRLQTNSGKLPIKICGPIRSGVANLDGSISSQFLSGLLLTLPFCEGEYVVKVKNLKSRPYVDLTLQILKDTGIEIHYSKDYCYFQIQGGQKAKGSKFKVEGDWSSIVTLLVMGAVAGELSISNINCSSVQADKAVLSALESTGAILQIKNQEISVRKPETLKAFEFDAEDCPDAIPVLVALAVNCTGKSVIKGAKRLKHKESDRASALCEEYSKTGGIVTVEDNNMIVSASKIRGGSVYGHNDHRIVMSLAIAGLNSSNGIEIDGFEAVAKSYPDFFKDLDNVRTK